MEIAAVAFLVAFLGITLAAVDTVLKALRTGRAGLSNWPVAFRTSRPILYWFYVTFAIGVGFVAIAGLVSTAIALIRHV